MNNLIAKAKTYALAATVVASVIIPAAVSAQSRIDFGINYAANIGLGTRDVRDTIASLIKTAMGLLGIVATVLVLYGGFQWMIAGGEEKKVDRAKKTIYMGVIGLLIILSAYGIASYVLTNLVTATQ